MDSIAATYGAIAIFCLVVVSSYYLVFSKSRGNLPPEAGGGRPILGHLHLMGSCSRAKLPHISLAAMADKYGPILTIRLGVHRVVVISNCEIAKELFTTCDISISSRPRTCSARHLSNNFAMFGFAPYGAYWRDLRKIVTVELLSSRRVKMLSQVGFSETVQSVKEIYSRWEEEKDSNGQVSMDLKDFFSDLNLNVVARIVAGKRLSDSRVGVAEMQRCREVIRNFFHLAGVFVVGDAVPWLGWLDLGGYEKTMKKVAKEIDEIMQSWVEEHRRKEEDSGGSKVEDFMDMMLSVVRGSQQFGEKFDVDTVIKSTCQTIILGAVDTSTVMLTWALSLLLNNRSVLTKAQEELDNHVGRDRRVKESDIHNLVYLQAIVKETLRLYPAAPLGGVREFIEDCNVLGFHIPKGTWLMVNLWKLQRDPNVWSDPLEFRPERFLTTHKNVDIKGKDFELIPFGAGRRMCPGSNLGMHTIHTILANFLHAFDFDTVCNEAIDMTESAGVTNLKATPLNVRIAPRLNPNVY